MNEELIANQSAKPTVLLTKDRENRVYIAGPMTGLPEFNFPAFNTMAATMRAEGWHVENPAEHGHVEGAEWADYLRHDIGRLGTCEAVLLLPGWSKSLGAMLERHIAEQLGLRVMLAEGAEPADQHQGEPVAWQYRVSAGPATGWSFWSEGKGEKFREHYTVETRPLYTHPPLQSQGEPVAWRGINSLGEVVTDWIDGAPPSGFNHASYDKIELAYAQADAEEVELLRVELGEAKGEYDRSANKVEALRAQLAERDALLRGQSGKLIVLASHLLQEPLRALSRDLDSEGSITRIKVMDGVERASDSLGGLAMEIRRVADALSASAEPTTATDDFSAEQMAAQGADGYRNGIKAAAELAEAYPELAQAIRALPLPQ